MIHYPLFVTEFIVGDETVTALVQKLSLEMETAPIADVDRIIFVLEDMFREDTAQFSNRRSEFVFGLFRALFSKLLVSRETSLLRLLNKGIQWCLGVSDVDNENFKTFIRDCALLVTNQFEKRLDYSCFFCFYVFFIFRMKNF